MAGKDHVLLFCVGCIAVVGIMCQMVYVGAGLFGCPVSLIRGTHKPLAAQLSAVAECKRDLLHRKRRVNQAIDNKNASSSSSAGLRDRVAALREQEAGMLHREHMLLSMQRR
jgi:hypothetical protein